MIYWKPDCRSRKQKQKNQTNHKTWERALSLVYPSVSASDFRPEEIWLRIRLDFWFSLSHKRSYSVTSENQRLRSKSTLDTLKSVFNAFWRKPSLGAPALNAACSWIRSVVLLLSEDLQLCHTKWQYVKWSRMDNLLISRPTVWWILGANHLTFERVMGDFRKKMSCRLISGGKKHANKFLGKNILHWKNIAHEVFC